MRPLDLVIIFGYLIGITAFGILFSGKQETTEDYFVGDRSVPWWAIAMSIVATETSTITFISVPGYAVADGLPAAGRALRRTRKNSRVRIVRNNAEHRRWYPPSADGDRPRSCLYRV